MAMQHWIVSIRFPETKSRIDPLSHELKLSHHGVSVNRVLRGAERWCECRLPPDTAPKPGRRQTTHPLAGSAWRLPFPEGEKRILPTANLARRKTRWDTRNSTRQSGRGGRGTPDAWSVRSAPSSRNRFGPSDSGSIENGVSVTGPFSTLRSTAGCVAATS